MTQFTYQLRTQDLQIHSFYKVLEEVCQEILFKGYLSLGTYLPRQSKEDQNPSVWELEMLDMLIMGTLWKEHGRKAINTSKVLIRLMNRLQELRRKYPSQKALIDWVKGILNPVLFKDRHGFPEHSARKSIEKLVIWLQSTGEYRKQSIRISSLLKKTEGMNDVEFRTMLNRIADFTEYSLNKAHDRLGEFVNGIDSFLSQHSRYKGREDYIMTGRKASEYYLNFIGAEILNRALEADFRAHTQFIVFAPACMRSGINCQAMESEEGLNCRQCSENCPVYQLQRNVEKYNATVLILPHTSDYIKYIHRVQSQNKAYIGIACALNLLEGGYEMMDRKIPSQCVYLDYSGCSKHWLEKRVPTQISFSKLESILGKKDKSVPLSVPADCISL